MSIYAPTMIDDKWTLSHLCLSIDTCLTVSWSPGERGAAALVKELWPTNDGPDPSEHDPQRPGAGRHFIPADDLVFSVSNRVASSGS